jgi:hypothetical protein
MNENQYYCKSRFFRSIIGRILDLIRNANRTDVADTL